MTCKVTVVTPKPTRVPAAGDWLMCTGAESLQALATRPLVVKSGARACQTPSAKALWLEAQVLMVGGVLSVTVNLAVQVDSLFAARSEERRVGKERKPTRVPAAGNWLMCTGAEPLQSLATRPLVVKSGTGA